MDIVVAPLAPPGRFEFRAGPEIAAPVDGEVVAGPIDDPDVVVEVSAARRDPCDDVGRADNLSSDAQLRSGH
jgi:hypothetical protein